jgi:predicted small secreted protein
VILIRPKLGNLLFFVVAISFLLSSCAMRSGAGHDFIPTAVSPLQASDTPPELMLEKYWETQKTQPRLADYQVDVRIEASLPAMHRSGSLSAKRILRGTEDLSYAGSQFTGDDSVKSDVIIRYLNAEKESLRRPMNVGLTPENYKFIHRGVTDYLNHRAHVFEVVPKQRRLGLYRGELWLDTQTGQPLREFGRFVRNPSVFLKDVDFVRDYNIIDGRSVPVRVITTMETRLVGPAEITVYLNNYDFHVPPAADHQVSIGKSGQKASGKLAGLLE